MRSLLLTPALLAVGACATTPSVVGGWRQDGAATRHAIEQASDRLTDEQRQLLLSPRFLGNGALVYGEHEAAVAYDGRCDAPAPYTVVELHGHDLRVRVDDPKSGALDMTLTFDGNDRFSIAIPSTDARQIFARVPVGELTREIPCLGAPAPR